DLLAARGCRVRGELTLTDGPSPAAGRALDLLVADWRRVADRPPGWTIDALRATAARSALVLLGPPPDDGEALQLADGCLPWPVAPALLLHSCERALERLQLAREGQRLSER